MFNNQGIDAVLSKEEMRIQRKREVNEQRRLRLLDARRRVIGLDVEGLNEQVAEKSRMNCDRNELERLEKIRMLEIEKVLAAAAEDEVQMREFQKKEMKKSWDEATRYKKERPKSPPVHIDSTGVSAAQVFQGEDRGYWDRQDRAKDQMKRWIQEQVAEKTFIKEKARFEDKQYGEIMKLLDSQRGGAEDEEKEMRNYLKNSINADNQQLAVAQKDRRFERAKPYANLSEEEIMRATSLGITEETPDSAVDKATGRILRKDLFKGYTEAQTKRLWRENDKIRAEHRDKMEREANSDREYALGQFAINKAQELAAFEEKAFKQEMTYQQMKTIKDQRREQQERKELDKKSKFGSIDSAFFQNFGTSCR